MADKHGEALCGLMDGELGETEARFLLGRLGRDRDLSARWGRYHLARSVVRQHARADLNGFAARVAAELEADAPGISPAARFRLGWLKPLGGVAVAASVALLAFNLWRTPVLESEPQAADTQVAAPLVQSAIAPLTPASATQTAPGWNPRLQSYLIRHNEATGPHRGQVLASYWNLVSEVPPRVEPADEPETEQVVAED